MCVCAHSKIYRSFLWGYFHLGLQRTLIAVAPDLFAGSLVYIRSLPPVPFLCTWKSLKNTKCNIPVVMFAVRQNKTQMVSPENKLLSLVREKLCWFEHKPSIDKRSNAVSIKAATTIESSLVLCINCNSVKFS